MSDRPDIVIVMTDEERAVPPYESADVLAWRQRTLTGRRWFDEHGVSFTRHYTGSLACVPSRPTIFTGQYPDLHGVTQTDGIGKRLRRFADALAARRRGAHAGQLVPRRGLRHPLRRQVAHLARRPDDPATGGPLATNDDDGVVDPAAVQRYLDADPLAPYGFSGWVGPEPHGAGLANSGFRRDPLIADRVVAWLNDRYARRRAGDAAALRPFLLVASFVNPHDIVLFPAWVRRSPLQPSPLDPPQVPAGAHRRRGPVDQAGRADRLPRGLLLRIRSGAGDQPHLQAQRSSATATCTTACTPRSTARSTGCAARSPKAAPTTPCWCAPPITAICSGRTAACTRSGSTSTTRRPGCRSSSPASGDTRPQPRAVVAHRPRTSTWCRRCSPRPASTSTPWPPRWPSRSPRCTRCPAAT